MRSFGIAVLAALLLLGASARALACDPSWEACGDDLPADEPWTSWADPSDEPAWSDPAAWSAPGSDDLDAASTASSATGDTPMDPDARRGELGLHVVTEVYAGHTVTTEGPVTTYGTATLSSDPGTAARLVATVATGEASAFDAEVLGGRMTLSDGRPVAGAVYENYVWDGTDYVLNAYVFFQDDSEVARATETSTPVPAPTDPPAVALPDPIPAPALVAPPIPAEPVPGIAVTPVVVPTIAEDVAPASVDPITDDMAPTTPPTGGPSRPATRVIRAGVALAPQADPLDRVEVLRGRRIALWVRAAVDGAPARVSAWRLLSGEVIALGPISGDGDEPLVATWRDVSTPGTAFPVRLRVSVDVPGEGIREVDAGIDVVVRAPALVE